MFFTLHTQGGLRKFYNSEQVQELSYLLERIKNTNSEKDMVPLLTEVRDILSSNPDLLNQDEADKFGGESASLQAERITENLADNRPGNAVISTEGTITVSKLSIPPNSTILSTLLRKSGLTLVEFELPSSWFVVLPQLESY